MQELSVFWLRGAVIFYFFALAHVAALLLARSQRWFRFSLVSFCIGVVLHVVSVVEEAHLIGQLPANNFWESVSLLGLLAAIAFLLVYWRYKFESLSIIIFPLVLLATLTGALGSPSAVETGRNLRDAWLLLHVVLVLLGYSALLLTAAASIVYLVHEWQLKQKRPHALTRRLPPLLATDSLIYYAMAWGFVFITLGVISGSTWAYMESGTAWITDGKIAISFITWLAYLAMIFMRVSAGWRGRKAAILVLCVVGFSAATWMAHVGLAPGLVR